MPDITVHRANVAPIENITLVLTPQEAAVIRALTGKCVTGQTEVGEASQALFNALVGVEGLPYVEGIEHAYHANLSLEGASFTRTERY